MDALQDLSGRSNLPSELQYYKSWSVPGYHGLLPGRCGTDVLRERYHGCRFHLRIWSSLHLFSAYLFCMQRVLPMQYELLFWSHLPGCGTSRIILQPVGKKSYLHWQMKWTDEGNQPLRVRSHQCCSWYFPGRKLRSGSCNGCWLRQIHSFHMEY